MTEPRTTAGPHGLGPLIDGGSMAVRDRLPIKPDAAVLHGERVLLRAAAVDDALELHEISCGAALQRLGRRIEPYDPDERIWRYMPVGPFRDGAAYRAFLASVLARPDWRTFVVADRSNGSLLGSVSLIGNSPADLKVEIGALWCTPPAQGLGVVDEACGLLLDHLFGLGYLRVEWKCHAGNQRSRSAAERLGFRFEGVQEALSIQKGRRRDTAWFRVLREEWGPP